MCTVEPPFITNVTEVFSHDSGAADIELLSELLQDGAAFSGGCWGVGPRVLACFAGVCTICRYL